MTHQPERREEPTEVATAGGGDKDELLDHVLIGERVTAVLESAKRGAEDILAIARREADRLVAEADDAAAATANEAARKAEEIRREAEQVRTQAKSYSLEVRKAADAYAAENRRSAEETAAKTLLEAEERAKKASRESTRKARQIEDEARRRQSAIVAESGRFEDRLQSLLTVFQGMTEQLEELLAKRDDVTGDQKPTEDALQETLEKSIKSRRSNARPS